MDQSGNFKPGLVICDFVSVIASPMLGSYRLSIPISHSAVLSQLHLNADDGVHFSNPMGDITQILQGWNADRDIAIEQLTPLVYKELHKIAASYMRGTRPDHTLQPTALINEAYLRMVKQEGASYQDRSHFFALAAKMMRGILVDSARARASEKRGSGGKVQLDDNMDVCDSGASEFLVVHEALEMLKEVEPRKAAVIELRFFGGLTFEEIAEAQGISVITAKRDSTYAEAWLRRALSVKKKATTNDAQPTRTCR